ncbi:hypothetical protein LAZ67_18000046 [Cordylochernes scorpioides]|uniref:SLC41A/MgtE integral membrane domain-containing protein n=1 Tax=Cordylochernes scorpioides TaxID=51811 RepID=A0ABY6LEM3_9ARAC|nr:hypothetical protein LAZ67_18000046 [Cordylochernes scorpioides]
MEDDAPTLGFQHEHIPRHIEVPQIIIEGAEERSAQEEDEEIRQREVKRKHSQDESIPTSNPSVNTQDQPAGLCDIQNNSFSVKVPQDIAEMTTIQCIPTAKELENQTETITEIQNSSIMETEDLSGSPIDYQESDIELEVLTAIALEALDLSYQKSSDSADDAKEADRLSIISTTLENDRGSDSGRESAQAEVSNKVDSSDKKRSVLLNASNLSIKSNTDSGIFVEDGKADVSKIPKDELPTSSLLSIFLQIFIPYLLAGVGTCATGLLLDKVQVKEYFLYGRVQHWRVFKEIPQLFILVPPLLGLKGNLEMTLASRLSTQANLGNLDTKQQQWKASWGNTAAITCQAVVVGLLAAVFAVVMGVVQRGMRLEHVLVLTAGCLATAVLASFLLAIVTILVVIYAPRLGVDPDNVATPVAASLGDLTTLAVLAYCSHFLNAVPSNLDPRSYRCSMSSQALSLRRRGGDQRVAGAAATPAGAQEQLQPASAQDRLDPRRGLGRHHQCQSRSEDDEGCPAGVAPCWSGRWEPSTAWPSSSPSSTISSSLSFLSSGTERDLVQVWAATWWPSMPAAPPPSSTRAAPWRPGSASPPARSSAPSVSSSHGMASALQSIISRMLLFMVLPGHAIFAYSLHALRGYSTALTNPIFLPIYLGAAFLQVLVLLYVGSVLVRLLWRMGADPDNSAIPLLTALGDLLGSLLLALAFYCFSLL